MKNVIIFILLLLLAASVWHGYFNRPQKTLNPLIKIMKPKPLLAYSFDNLKKTQFVKSDIVIDKELDEGDAYKSYEFHLGVPRSPGDKPSLKVSGMITAPQEEGTYPVIVMLRGFVPEDSYTIGAGTVRAAQVFASSGFITIAPDFLGFGESDKGSKNGFEDRFQTYTTVLTLLSSLESLNTTLSQQNIAVKADVSRIGLWGHSNGGHIALAVLAITGKDYPTALWAPVSKSFPYSILYYSDEFDDQGKSLRQAVSEFERDYDVRDFSPRRYYSRIKAPIQINQGLTDQEVPYWWSDELSAELENKKVEVEYQKYSNADHNLLPSGWSSAVSDNIAFYKSFF